MNFEITLRTLFENHQDIFFEISKDLFGNRFGIENEERLTHHRLEPTIESHLEHYNLMEENRKEEIKISACHILDKTNVTDFLISFLNKHFWHESYKIREILFSWVAYQGFVRITKNSFCHYSDEVVSEFENEMLRRFEAINYSFIPDDSPIFSLNYLPEDSWNTLYWLSRAFNEHGKTANVGQLYQKIKKMLGYPDSKKVILFEVEVKRHLLKHFC